MGNKLYKFTWDMFTTLSKEDKQNALEQYILSNNAITGNIFELYKFFIRFYQTKDLYKIFLECRGRNASTLIERNFKALMRHCLLYNFFHCRDLTQKNIT